MRRKAQRGMKAIGTGHSMKHQIIESSTCFKRTLDALVRVMPTAPTRIVTTSTYKKKLDGLCRHTHKYACMHTHTHTQKGDWEGKGGKMGKKGAKANHLRGGRRRSATLEFAHSSVPLGVVHRAVDLVHSEAAGARLEQSD